MALHRDIFWVGRQWAVTGHGLQAVDQKQKSKFDVDICRLWQDDLTNDLSAEHWFNAEDFSKGLSIARARYPEPAGENNNVQPPQPVELARESLIEYPPPREPLSTSRDIAPINPPRPVPKVDLPEPVISSAAPSHDTWASLAELARSAVPSSSRKPPLPQSVAPPEPVAPKASLFAAPAKPAPRFEAPKSVSPMIEPEQACLPFDMRIESSGAKFSRMWRIRLHR
jgi:hypothetical protein